MSITILGESRYLVNDRIRQRSIICGVVLAVAVALNFVIMLLHTKEMLAICMVLNGLIDVAAGWFVIWQMDSFILPYRRLLRLYKRSGIIVSGVVEAVSSNTERYYGFDCFVITVDGHKLFIIDNGTIFVEIGQSVTLDTVHGIVKEVRL